MGKPGAAPEHEATAEAASPFLCRGLAAVLSCSQRSLQRETEDRLGEGGRNSL